ncbi:uncharacterized protein E0L32_000521 [Thyridium curvatum]|uniref:Uncharacterized protein n=1 Tax=Thyridium curvatum TaxID=1093900 RepID=A0A507B305_9PEZI|nr:uncharacterized protein E0L32_000521 [Thyridium curvatum]TPX14127.1 hypothetical protein E0L32_000521 [Thyridium curvatum]
MSPFFSSKRPDIDRQKQACIATKAMTNAPALIPTQATAEKLVRTGEPGVAVIEYDDLVVVYKCAPGVIDPPYIIVRNREDDEFVMVEDESYPKAFPSNKGACHD